MSGVLKGSSHESLAFLRTHWMGLLKVSAFPTLLIAILTWMQIRGLGPAFQSYIFQFQNPGLPPDPALVSEIAKSRWLDYTLEITTMILFMWKFVRIIRYWKKGEEDFIGIDRAEIESTATTIAYAVGMLALATTVSFAIVFAGGLVVGVAQSVFGPNLSIALMETLAVAAGIFFIAFLYRFLVGLPGIALGEKPHFISDIWPLARGENWALPLRQIVGFVVGITPIIIISLIFFAPVAEELRPFIEGQQKAPLPADLLQRLLSSFNTMQLIATFLQMPIMWFGTVLTGIAHFRFRKKLSS